VLLNKLTTIFGTDCTQRAKICREHKSGERQGSIVVDFWEDGDFDDALDVLQTECMKGQAKKKRVVRCYIEDWEATAIHKNDPVAEAKILKKYAGLEWYDPDMKRMCQADTDDLYWSGRHTRDEPGGWCLQSTSAGWDANDPRRHKYEDVWNLCEDCGLHDCIYDYYSENPELGIVPEKNLPEDNEDDEENND